MSAPPFADIVQGSAIYLNLTRTGTTIVDQIYPADFLIACNRNIDRSGDTIMVNGTQYDLNTLSFQNQA